jgi:hypothetical protein
MHGWKQPHFSTPFERDELNSLRRMGEQVDPVTDAYGYWALIIFSMQKAPVGISVTL